MKLKLFSILSMVLILGAFVGCNNNNNEPRTSETETFKTTTVFNPNSTKVKLLSVWSSRAAAGGDEVCEIEPQSKKEIQLGNEHDYYFTDENGNKIADLDISKDGDYLPVYLELNEPKEGKEYLLLNQYKTATALEDYGRKDKNGNSYNTFGLLLYEVINQNDSDAYAYKDPSTNAVTYVRTYPSANYWIDSEGYASNKIGTKITYNADFRNNFEALSNSWVAWGWSTKNTQYDTWFCHRVVSSILHAKDGNTYTVKEVGQKLNISLYNPTSSNISIYNSSDNPKEVVNANSSKTVQIYKDYDYYFKDGETKVSFNVSGSTNFVLKLEKPEVNKKYMCLNQYKKNAIDQSNDLYGFCLFEIVDSTSENAFKYSDNVYIRSYPAANYWINSESVVNELIGKEITYSDSFLNNLTLSYKHRSWGWSTKIEDKWYCHFCTQFGYKK